MARALVVAGGPDGKVVLVAGIPSAGCADSSPAWDVRLMWKEFHNTRKHKHTVWKVNKPGHQENTLSLIWAPCMSSNGLH